MASYWLILKYCRLILHYYQFECHLMDFMSQTQNFLFLFVHDWKILKMHHHLARVPFIHFKTREITTQALKTLFIGFFVQFSFYEHTLKFSSEIWLKSLEVVSSMTSFVRDRRMRFTNFLLWSILEAVFDFALVYAIHIVY